MSPPRAKRATLRLQFHGGFTLDDARRHVPYFAALGVSHIYASPLLAARPGSTHGYDIVDHNRINPELGGEEALARFVAALSAHDMGLILDFVPNHMGVGGSDNAWWLDVLEWGRASPYARFFDIDWDLPAPWFEGKLLVPFLGAHYAAVLHAGELALRFDADEGAFAVWYHEHKFPIALRDTAGLLGAAARHAPKAAASLETLAQRFARCVHDDAPAAKAALAEAVRAGPEIAAAIAATVDEINGRAGEPQSFAELHRLLERQCYRLAYWRVAVDEINYRRFFDINSLAALRMEDEALFEASHRLTLRLVAEGAIDGIRLDHVDGLLDPEAYCRRLQEHAAAVYPSDEPFYILVEKILAPHERLRQSWPVAGTTGYDFMAQIGGLMVDAAGFARIAQAYARFTGNAESYEETAEAARRQVVRNNLASELAVLAGLVHRLARSNLATRDYTLNALRLALLDIVACFPVYRTYVGEAGADDEDRRDLDWAVARARRSPGLLDRSIYDFLYAVLAVDLERLPGQGWRRDDVLAVARKFQQFTGPVAAKSEEDTAFYRYVPLVSVNEVGSNPARPAITPGAFHYACQDRLRRHPGAMLATATHDHKRGEDARARLAVLSEIPNTWTRQVRRWARLNRSKRREVGDAPAPSRNDEYLLYQTLVGAWPLGLAPDDAEGLAAYAARIEAYMLKAVREAKLATSWAMPDEAYEDALASFVGRVLDAHASRAFLDALTDFVGGIAPAGALNGLVQTALKLTVPGVPDTFQGTERWDFSLVDPDNRRPVDFEALARGLAEVAPLPLPALLDDWRSGLVKQAMIARLLADRAAHPALYAAGDYIPLEAYGALAERVLAFSRAYEGEVRVVAVPRLVAPLLGEAATPMLAPERWQDTAVALPEGAPETLTDFLTGEVLRPDADRRLPLAAALARFPVAVLAG